MDCSSPMSAQTASKQGNSEPLSAGMCNPDCAISASNPTYNFV